MKRLLYCSIIISVCLSGIATSCSDLELDESVYHTKTYQFSDFDKVKEVMTNVYGYLETGFAPIEGTMRDCASDDAIYAGAIDPTERFYDGSWSANYLIDDKWAFYYEAIRTANYLIENCPEDFPSAQWQETYERDLEQLKNYPYEAKALRAWYHFELLKRYNRIIIADRSFKEDEVNSLSQATFEDAAGWIAAELYEASGHLPANYSSGLQAQFSELGRVTRGFALAARARVLLYAASPLNNPDNDKEKYFAAAAAAKDFIDWNTTSRTYSLVEAEAFNREDAKGLIFGIREKASNVFERANFPVGFEGGNSGVCPTENLVEAFESGDPRLARTIIRDGDTFKDIVVESFYGGRNGQPRDLASPTSFYLRKFIQESTNLATGSTTSFQHIWPVLRLHEVYLNYAEALFEATGDPYFSGSHNGISYTMSPAEAVNAVRKTAPVADLPAGLDAETFRTRLRNERRVELAFEDHRFWDIRRWKIGEETTEIYGLYIEYGGRSEKVTVQTRVWDDRMYFYPIPASETFKNLGLEQNTGW